MIPARSFLQWLFERMVTPFERFLRRTTAGGFVLIGATAATLAISAAIGDERVHHFWERPFALSLGESSLSLSLHHWVNDGLMAVFFLLVGLELKREILIGELSSIRDAALPVAAAVGGMLLPAAIFFAFAAGTPFVHGWGIPMATDIAFAIGILVLLGRRIPKNLIVFLTALAIADDLGAVLVIAMFYTAQIDLAALGIAAAIGGALLAMNLGGIRRPFPYIVAGIVLWFFTHRSGVHSTVAGIIVAMAVPAREKDSPLERWEHALTPWVTFVILPVFAFSNAGIDLTAIAWRAALASPLTAGIVTGLVVGKFAGIALFSWAAIRAGLARLPTGVAWRHLLGAAWLAGIGFTMSLFIAQLAFDDPVAVEDAKLGILAGSAISAAIGLAWLWKPAAER